MEQVLPRQDALQEKVAVLMPRGGELVNLRAIPRTEGDHPTQSLPRRILEHPMDRAPPHRLPSGSHRLNRAQQHRGGSAHHRQTNSDPGHRLLHSKSSRAPIRQALIPTPFIGTSPRKILPKPPCAPAIVLEFSPTLRSPGSSAPWRDGGDPVRTHPDGLPASG